MVGFKTVTLSSAILSEDETSKVVTKCIILNLEEGHSMLTAWREITKRGYFGQQELIDMIPSTFKLSIANIAQGDWIMTDTCNADRKFRRLLIEDITEIANKQGMTRNQIKIFEAGKLYNILLHHLQMKKAHE